MLLPLLLLVQYMSIDAAIADYRLRTRAEVPCARPSDDDEIVVCARRDADRYRVPLIVRSPDRDSDSLRMARLLSPDASGYVPCGKGAFMVKCGSVGVTMTSGGETRAAERPLAP